MKIKTNKFVSPYSERKFENKKNMKRMGWKGAFIGFICGSVAGLIGYFLCGLVYFVVLPFACGAVMFFAKKDVINDLDFEYHDNPNILWWKNKK